MGLIGFGDVAPVDNEPNGQECGQQVIKLYFGVGRNTNYDQVMLGYPKP